MRVLFAGSPEVALPTLRAIAASAHDLVGVITQPPRPVGRKQVLTPTPVATLAAELGVDCVTPKTTDGVLAAVETWSPEIAVVVAYGRLLGPAELESVPLGWWNVHFSILPRWRGATPVQHALQEGDQATGISIFRLEESLDTGPIAASVHYDVAPHDTSRTVLARLSELAGTAVMTVLNQAEEGLLVVAPQRGEPSYAPKPPRDVGLFDWSLDASTLYNRFRAWGEEPGCFTFRSDNEQRVNIIEGWSETDRGGLSPGELSLLGDGVAVGTGEGSFVLTRVQPAGKGPMDARDWYRGLPPGVGFRA